MPVRNFWITARVDGQSRTFETGPRSKDGGFKLNIMMRDNGGISRAVDVDGYVRPDGTIRLTMGLSRESERGTLEARTLENGDIVIESRR